MAKSSAIALLSIAFAFVLSLNGVLADLCPGNQEVNTTTDAANCGGCGTVCPAGYLCIDGNCEGPASNCTSLEILCNGECENLFFSESNCGACGKKCKAGEVCDFGECASESDFPIIPNRPITCGFFGSRCGGGCCNYITSYCRNGQCISHRFQD